MKKPDLFAIHTDPDPKEGTAYSIRPPMPSEPPPRGTRYFRTPEPMVYFTRNGRFRVSLSYKDQEGRWRLKCQTVDSIGHARRLRSWWKAIGRHLSDFGPGF